MYLCSCSGLWSGARSSPTLPPFRLCWEQAASAVTSILCSRWAGLNSKRKNGLSYPACFVEKRSKGVPAKLTCLGKYGRAFCNAVCPYTAAELSGDYALFWHIRLLIPKPNWRRLIAMKDSSLWLHRAVFKASNLQENPSASLILAERLCLDVDLELPGIIRPAALSQLHIGV